MIRDLVLIGSHGDNTGVRVDGSSVALRSLEVTRNGELGVLRNLNLLVSRLAVLVLLVEVRSRLSLAAREDGLVLVLRLKLTVLVRNLRVGVLLDLLGIRRAVTVIIRVLDIRRAVTIGVQLEVCLRLITGTIRVLNVDRNIEVFDSVLVELVLIDGHGDHTGVLVDVDGVAIRSLEVIRNGELGVIRNLNLLISRFTVLILLEERRRGRVLLVRINKSVLVLRLNLVSIALSSQNERSSSRSNRLVLVGDLHRHVKAGLRRRFLREDNRDLTRSRVNPDGVALGSRKALRELKLGRLLLRILFRQIISRELLFVIGRRVVESRSLRLRGLTDLFSLGLLIEWLPADQHRKRISGNRAASRPSLLVDRVQVRGKRRRGLDAIREDLLVTSIQLAGLDGAGCLWRLRSTGLHNLAGVTVYPLDLVLQTLSPRDRQATRLGISLVTRLGRVLVGVVLEHIKNGVVRVHNVTVLQEVRLTCTDNKATSPLALTVERVLVTRQEGVVVERRELAKPLSLLGGEEQPIPVHVLRQVIPATARPVLLPATVVSSRSNLTKQAVSVVLRLVWEDHLSTVVTSKVGVDQRAVIITTVNFCTDGHSAAKGALELEVVEAIATDGGFSGLSNPLILAFYSHLALDPVLQRNLVTVGPTTTTDLLETKIVRSLLLDLVDRVVRQVGAVNLHTCCRHIGAIVLVQQVRSERTLPVPQVPEKMTPDLARTIANHGVLSSIITVHHIMADLLTERETHISHAVGPNEPAHGVNRVISRLFRAEATKPVAVQLGEVIRIRVICPHADLLVLRAIRVRIKLHNLALGVIEGLHVDGVTAICASDSGVHRRVNAALLGPLSVDADTFHRNRLPRIRGARMDIEITVTLVNDVTLDRFVGALRGARLDRTLHWWPRGEGVALLIHHRLVDTVSIVARVLDAITSLIRLASLIWSASNRCRHSRRVHNRLRKWRDERHGERRSRDGCAAAAGDVLNVHVFLPETVNVVWNSGPHQGH